MGLIVPKLCHITVAYTVVSIASLSDNMVPLVALHCVTEAQSTAFLTGLTLTVSLFHLSTQLQPSSGPPATKYTKILQAHAPSTLPTKATCLLLPGHSPVSLHIPSLVPVTFDPLLPCSS